jgi:hypothetical protein
MFKTGDVVNWVGLAPAIGVVVRGPFKNNFGNNAYELKVPNTTQKYDSCYEKHLEKVSEKEKIQFFSDHPELHLFYIKDHGDMEGWRYLDKEEKVLRGDELFIDSSKEWVPSHNWTSGKQVPEIVYRRKIQNEIKIRSKNCTVFCRILQLSGERQPLY